MFKQWPNLLDLTLKYGNDNPLTTDYKTQVTNFATGKAAMMQQGNWTQVDIDKLDPNIEFGILPMPIGDKGDKLDQFMSAFRTTGLLTRTLRGKKKRKSSWIGSSLPKPASAT